LTIFATASSIFAKWGDSMDKYQEYLIKYLNLGFTTKELSYFSRFEKNQVSLDKNKEKLLINQGTNPTIENFYWMIGCTKDSVVQSIEYFIENTWIAAEIVAVDNRLFFVMNADFKKRIEKLKFCIKSNMTDDIILPVEFVEISSEDKMKYYEKVASEKRDEYISAASISHSTGADLVNIYFQPCCDKYEYTEILLYIPKEEIVKGWTGDGRKVVEIPSWSMIKKCKVPAEDFYKSINGLAPGTYSFVIKQYDKKDELLMETEHIEFQIKVPKPQFMGRVNRI
jgi:hypothetical protein